MEYPKTDKHAAFQVQLRVNFADGSGGGQRTRIVGTEGVINLGWNDFVLKKHLLPEAPGYGGWDLYGTFPEDVKKSFVARYDKEYPPDTRKVTQPRSEEHTSELQSLMRTSYAFFCLNKNKNPNH